MTSGSGATNATDGVPLEPPTDSAAVARAVEDLLARLAEPPDPTDHVVSDGGQPA